MKELDKAYNEMILPRKFVSNFRDKGHFREWASRGCVNDLKAAIKTFEYHELYEYCSIMQDIIDERINNMLSGLGFND